MDDIMKQIEQGLDRESVTNLAEGIVYQAAQDYMAAFNGEYVDGKEPRITMSECDQFFHSEWFHELTNLSGDGIPEKLQVRAMQDMVDMLERALVHANSCNIKLEIYEKGVKKPFTFKLPGNYAKEVKSLLWKKTKTLKTTIKEAEGCIKEKAAS